MVLIIDKSSSMEGRKIELARLSAIGVIDHLRPVDTIGVLIFDNSFQWAVPIRRAEDKSLIKRLVSGITPDGGTQIAPALTEAYRKVRRVQGHLQAHCSSYRRDFRGGRQHRIWQKRRRASGHDFHCGPWARRESQLSRESGGDLGRPQLFLNEPQGLEQILLKDVQDFSGSTAIERSLVPIVEQKAEVLDGVGMESAPPLKGYARFVAKPGAETILAINKEEKDPLYTRWQYGLGPGGGVYSDAKSRWADAWVDWPDSISSGLTWRAIY